MKRRLDGLKDVLGTRTVIRVDRRPIDPDYLDGFLVGLAPRHVLLHLIDPNVHLNGYAALRARDITGWQILDRSTSFLPRAVQLLGFEPEPRPEIDLSGMPGLIASVNQQYPLVTIHCEIAQPGPCWIGRVEKAVAGAIDLRKINQAAEWIEVERFRYADITRVDFGGGYEDTLARVATHEAIAGPMPPDLPWN